MSADRKSRRRKAPQPAPRRWRPALAAAAGVALLLGAALAGYGYLSQPGRLPLRVVEVNGEFQQLETAQIQQVVMGAIDGGFFGCDMQKLRTAVLAMPWVEDVSIRRVWPDRLRMTVSEQVPLARWGEDALINVSGVVFRPEALDASSGLVKLHGPAGSERRVVEFFQVALPAARARGLQISEVELDQRRHWWLRFENGVTVSLGRENVDYRLAQFFRVYPSLAAGDARQPERIDMRYAHGFAVRWRENGDTQPGAAGLKSQDKV
jgi:cell division protein FtsQ